MTNPIDNRTVPTNPFDIRRKQKYPPPRKRPIGESNMTMAAAFRFRGGLLICADAEITRGDILKTGESKVLNLAMSGGADVATAGAGAWSYAKMAFEKISNRLFSTQVDKLSVVSDAVEETVLEIFGQHIAVYPYEPKPSFSLLLIAKDQSGRLGIIKSDDTAVTTHNEFEMIGSGEFLGRYIANALYDHRKILTAEEAMLLAHYLLYATKRFVPGVGGNTSLVWLEAGSSTIGLMPGGAAGDKRFEKFEDITQAVFYEVSGYRETKNTEEVVGRLAERIRTILNDS